MSADTPESVRTDAAVGFRLALIHADTTGAAS